MYARLASEPTVPSNKQAHGQHTCPPETQATSLPPCRLPHARLPAQHVPCIVSQQMQPHLKHKQQQCSAVWRLHAAAAEERTVSYEWSWQQKGRSHLPEADSQFDQEHPLPSQPTLRVGAQCASILACFSAAGVVRLQSGCKTWAARRMITCQVLPVVPLQALHWLQHAEAMPCPDRVAHEPTPNSLLLWHARSCSTVFSFLPTAEPCRLAQQCSSSLRGPSSCCRRSSQHP